MAQSHVHKFTFYFNVWMEVLLYQQSLHNFNLACMHMQVSIISNSIGFWLKVYEIINACLSAFTITDTHVSLYKRHACGRARIHAQHDRCSAADVLGCKSTCSLLCGLSLRSVLLLQTVVTVLLPTHPHFYFPWDDHAQQSTYIKYITQHFQYSSSYLYFQFYAVHSYSSLLNVYK